MPVRSVRRMTDSSPYTPLVLDKFRRRTYSLSLDLDLVDGTTSVFEACGKYPNGHSWEGVARTAIKEGAPEVAGKIEFDSEGSMFCAIAKEEEPLRRLGELMRDAVHDHARLRHYLETGDPDWFD